MTVTYSIAAFFITKLFPELLDMLDLHGSMLLHGICCIIGAVFLFFALEETKGETLDGIGKEERLRIERIHSLRLNSLM